MVALAVSGGIFLLLAALLMLPLHIGIEAEDGVCVFLRVLFLKFPLYPRPERRKRKRKKSAPKSKAPAEPTPPKKKEKTDLLHLIRLLYHIAGAILQKLSRHLHIRVLRYEISVSAGDAAKCAILTGAVSGASATLFELLATATDFRIRKNAPISVEPDFCREEPSVSILIDAYLRVGGLLLTLLAAGLAFVKQKNTK